MSAAGDVEAERLVLSHYLVRRRADLRDAQVTADHFMHGSHAAWWQTAANASEGWKAAEEGLTARTGPRPINTSGGLKSKGHPVGASGAGQVVEIWKQMRGLAGERQVSGNVDIGLTHNVGGTGQTCAVHVYERR